VEPPAGWVDSCAVSRGGVLQRRSTPVKGTYRQKRLGTARGSSTARPAERVGTSSRAGPRTMDGESRSEESSPFGECHFHSPGKVPPMGGPNQAEGEFREEGLCFDQGLFPARRRGQRGQKLLF